MKYIEHLQQLTKHFITHIETETSIAGIADILDCSERHVKTIVHYLHQEGYIHWVTHRGRGKKPTLTILFSNEELYFQEAKRKVQSEDYHDAFKMVETLSTHSQNEFQEWFMAHFGLSQKNTSEQTVDVLKYPFYETKLQMDPLYIISRHDAHMVQQIFDRLVEYDKLTQQLLPRIAHHWESSDGLLWTFYLRKGIKFHNGRELTSADVKASFERLIKKNVLLQEVVSINVRNKVVIQFELKAINYLFPRLLTGTKASIVPIEVVEENEERFRDFPIGSGPYQLTLQNKNMIRLDVFTEYFSERPWLDRIDIIKTPAVYKDNNYQSLSLNPPNETWKQVRRIEEGASFITFNCSKNGPIKDKQFRKMICDRLNPAELKNDREGREIVASSFCTERSKQSPNSIGTIHDKFDFMTDTLKIGAQQIRAGANFEKAALQLQIQLARFGISSTVELMSNQNDLEKYDLFVGGIALNDDRLLSVMTAFQSEHLLIYPTFDFETKKMVDQKIYDLKKIKDESDRWEMYFQLEDYLKEKYVIYFLNHRYHTVYEPKNSPLVNVDLNSNGRVDYRKVWKRYVQE